MLNSLLYATHIALNQNLFFKHHIWDCYAYVPGNKMIVNPKWKIKTQKYNESKGTFSFDSLKFFDGKKNVPLIFNFGWRERKHISNLRIDAIILKYEYQLEREILERMCKISDEGYDIISNGEVILEKYKGTQFLIDIDLKAPDYAYLDEKVPF